MRYLGIDYGDKHIGISLSDENGVLAFPLTTLSNSQNLPEDIKKLVEEKSVIGIVIGESKDFQGNDNHIMKKARKFAEEVKNTVSAEVFFEPEFMTSVEARHIQGGSEKTHASASAIILQSFLDKRKNNL